MTFTTTRRPISGRKIFALSFAFGIVTGIPLEFQFGMNWAKLSTFAGGVIGQTLAMEGVFAFFLESTFLGVLFSLLGFLGLYLFLGLLFLFFFLQIVSRGPGAPDGHHSVSRRMA